MLEEDLTPGEKLIVWRTRERYSFPDAAKFYGVSEKTYRAWEQGRMDPPNVQLGGIEPYEHFHVLRLRAGMTRRELADKVGKNPAAIQAEETGKAPCRSLVWFWTGEKIPSKRGRP